MTGDFRCSHTAIRCFVRLHWVAGAITETRDAHLCALDLFSIECSIGLGFGKRTLWTRLSRHRWLISNMSIDSGCLGRDHEAKSPTFDGHDLPAPMCREAATGVRSNREDRSTRNDTPWRFVHGLNRANLRISLRQPEKYKLNVASCTLG